MNEPRHIIGIALGEEMMSLLFYEGATLRCMRGIPPDAVFLGATYDFSRRAILAHFEHPSFPPLPYGCEAQQAPVVYEIIEHPLRETCDSFPRRIGNGEWGRE